MSLQTGRNRLLPSNVQHTLPPYVTGFRGLISEALFGGRTIVGWDIVGLVAATPDERLQRAGTFSRTSIASLPARRRGEEEPRRPFQAAGGSWILRGGVPQTRPVLKKCRRRG